MEVYKKLYLVKHEHKHNIINLTEPKGTNFFLKTINIYFFIPEEKNKQNYKTFFI